MKVEQGLSNLEYHVLLAMAAGPQYGYAIKKAVLEDSGGTLVPGAGSLYRLLARLMTHGLVEETGPPRDAELHPGLARKYYRLSAKGQSVLTSEARRLSNVAGLAVERLGLGEDD